MQDKNIMVLDEQDYEAIEHFQVLGLPKILSKVLICVNNGINISKDIEIAANMRQPQVSIATKKLLQYDYVNRISVKSDNKRGRSVYQYHMNYSILDIIEILKSKAYDECTNKINSAEKLEIIFEVI